MSIERYSTTDSKLDELVPIRLRFSGIDTSKTYVATWRDTAACEDQTCVSLDRRTGLLEEERGVTNLKKLSSADFITEDKN